MTIDELNALPEREAKREFFRCCGSTLWAREMTGRRPFTDIPSLQRSAGEQWWKLSPADWREAFSHHPKIGDIKSLRKKFGSTAKWASGEQAGVSIADERILKQLTEGNNLYEAKYGYIFIVCATGKNAGEMLDLLNKRLSNVPHEEIRIAAGEQAKITALRLEKLLS